MFEEAARVIGNIAIAFTVTTGTLGLGYLAFGSLTALVFTAGFAGGFVLWLLFRSRVNWSRIQIPYWLVLALFALHRFEKSRSRFFKHLADISGAPTPPLTSPSLYSWSYL